MWGLGSSPARLSALGFSSACLGVLHHERAGPYGTGVSQFARGDFAEFADDTGRGGGRGFAGGDAFAGGGIADAGFTAAE